MARPPSHQSGLLGWQSMALKKNWLVALNTVWESTRRLEGRVGRRKRHTVGLCLTPKRRRLHEPGRPNAHKPKHSPTHKHPLPPLRLTVHVAPASVVLAISAMKGPGSDTAGLWRAMAGDRTALLEGVRRRRPRAMPGVGSSSIGSSSVGSSSSSPGHAPVESGGGAGGWGRVEQWNTVPPGRASASLAADGTERPAVRCSGNQGGRSAAPTYLTPHTTWCPWGRRRTGQCRPGWRRTP